MSLTPERYRMAQGQNDAADQQPWRCAKCGLAVSRDRTSPLFWCDCIRHLKPPPKPKK